MSDSIIEGAKNPDEAVAALRASCEKHGAVRHVSISCSHAPGKLLMMVELDRNARAAAAEIGGLVFGHDLVCASYTLPPGFHCDGISVNGACLSACGPSTKLGH